MNLKATTRNPRLRWLIGFLLLLLCFHLPTASGQIPSTGLTLFGGARLSHAINGNTDGLGLVGLSFKTFSTGPMHTLVYETIDPRTLGSGVNTNGSGSLAIEEAAIWRLSDSSRFTLGVLFGANADLKGTEDPLTYMAAAVGGVGTVQLTGWLFKWTKPWGAWYYGKYKYNPETNAYRNGWELGGGLYFHL